MLNKSCWEKPALLFSSSPEAAAFEECVPIVGLPIAIFNEQQLYVSLIRGFTLLHMYSLWPQVRFYQGSFQILLGYLETSQNQTKLSWWFPFINSSMTLVLSYIHLRIQKSTWLILMDVRTTRELPSCSFSTQPLCFWCCAALWQKMLCGCGLGRTRKAFLRPSSSCLMWGQTIS